MYASIRRYEVPRKVGEEVVQRSYDELWQVLSQRPGFIAYEIVIGEDSFVAISVFDTWVSAEESAIVAADWVKKNVSGATFPPQVTQGEFYLGRGENHLPFAPVPEHSLTDPTEQESPVSSLIRKVKGNRNH